MTDLPRPVVVRDPDLAQALVDVLADPALVCGFDQEPAVLDLNVAGPAGARGVSTALPWPDGAE